MFKMESQSPRFGPPQQPQMQTGGGMMAAPRMDPTMGPLGKWGTAPGHSVNNSPMFGPMAGSMRWNALSPHGGGPRVPKMGVGMGKGRGLMMRRHAGMTPPRLGAANRPTNKWFGMGLE